MILKKLFSSLILKVTNKKSFDLLINVAGYYPNNLKSENMLTTIDETKYKNTPMINQYFVFKKKYPNMIIFYQMGEFYEVFFEDAEKVSRILNIVLTKRGYVSGKNVPMAGIPCNNLNYYLKILINKGESVVICDQTIQICKDTRILERKVSKIITPGTIIDEELLEENFDAILGAVYKKKNKYVYSTLNLGSGRFYVSKHDNVENLLSKIECTSPNELLYPENSSVLKHINKNIGLKPRSILDFDIYSAKKLLNTHFKTQNLLGFGINDSSIYLGVAGCLLLYVKSMYSTNELIHIKKIKVISDCDHIQMNSTTIKNLEIVKNILGGEKNTLFSVLNNTSTKMGSRMLKRWMCFPSRSIKTVKNRQCSILDLQSFYKKIKFYLSNIYDLERIIARICLRTALPKDFLCLKQSIKLFPKISFFLLKTRNKYLFNLSKKIVYFPKLYFLLKKSINENPNNSIRNGGFIAENYSLELDELRKLKIDSEIFLRNIEIQERIKLKIKSLKIGFNSLIGYYLQVNKKYSNLIPLHYVKKQTIKHSERYVFPLLQEYQEKFLTAELKAIELEKILYEELFDLVFPYIQELQTTINVIAELDVLSNLSERSITLNYVCPKIEKTKFLQIDEGRHPIIETMLDMNFIPNGIDLSNNKTTVIITGPNMGGKSTYMRQIALIVILSWMGSFVPATSARIGPIDKIFTRIGASDNLSNGQSTFMVEITEMASILNYSTKNSLVLIDEIGRGTSIIDGFSLAWSCIKYLIEKKKSMTLFATHYFDLTNLSKKFNSIKNMFFRTIKKDGKIVFLYSIQPGKARNSYGLLVSELAGFPDIVIQESLKKVKSLEHLALNQKKGMRIIKFLKSVNLEKVSFVDAKKYISKIKSMI